MTKDVLVTISGHMSAEEDQDMIEVTTKGLYYLKNGKHYVLFDEIGEDPASVVNNKVVVAGNHVDVHRKGAIDSQMSFELNQKLNSFYVTAYGQMELGVLTDSMQFEEKEDQIFMELHYHLDVNNEYVSDNCLKLLVQPLCPAAEA